MTQKPESDIDIIVNIGEKTETIEENEFIKDYVIITGVKNNETNVKKFNNYLRENNNKPGKTILLATDDCHVRINMIKPICLSFVLISTKIVV